MTNIHRSDYAEAMVYLALRDSGWKRMEPWELWDLQNDSGVKLEVKQGAAAQSWRGFPPSSPRFDIAPRDGFGRSAHIYVFAWHGEGYETADHRDPNEWEFYVVAEGDLPVKQKTIGLTKLRSLSTPCRIEHLATRVLHCI